MDFVLLLANQIDVARAAHGQVRGVARTTGNGRKVLLDYWLAEINHAREAGIDAFGNEREFDAIETSLRVPNLSDKDFWNLLSRAAIALNVEQGAPSQWQLFVDAFNETLEERAKQWDSATKKLPSSSRVLKIGLAVAGGVLLWRVGNEVVNRSRAKRIARTTP